MRQILAATLFGMLISISLMGCEAVDHFGPRAVQYNQEASTTKSNTILLNILRSANKLPLQFTEYTSAVGQSFLSGQISGSLPVATIPTNTSKTFTLNPQVQGTAQTQMTIQNLNSQEFYYGLQTPLTPQMIATFMGVGYEPKLVLMLAVSSLKRKTSTEALEIENDPTDYNKFNQFYDAIDLLVEAGLGFETVQGGPRSIGPSLSETEAKALLAQYLTASATAAANGAANSMPELSQKGGLFQLTKSSSSFRICFKKSGLEKFTRRNSSGLNVTRLGGNNYRIHLELISRSAGLSGISPLQLFDMTVAASHLCGASPVAGSHNETFVDWIFELRSMEAIYNYLGNIVAVEWSDPELFDKYYRFAGTNGAEAFYLIKVYDHPITGAIFAASLGATYYVRAHSTANDDKTTQVVSLLTDLWALSSSAKTFPSTSTVSVTTQ